AATGGATGSGNAQGVTRRASSGRPTASASSRVSSLIQPSLQARAPVATGLHTATVRPCRYRREATAAAAKGLPTAVSVPVKKSPASDVSPPFGSDLIT